MLKQRSAALRAGVGVKVRIDDRMVVRLCLHVCSCLFYVWAFHGSLVFLIFFQQFVIFSKF